MYTSVCDVPTWCQFSKTMAKKAKRASPKKKKAAPKKKAAKSPKKAKRGKKAKKTGGAKRPLNAFMKFAIAHRAAVVKAHPNWKVTDVGRELGRLYRAAKK